ncbi:hypothetical protein [Hyalangium versicolor]|nr:hypothetical protein [Hyalangium versicolor]
MTQLRCSTSRCRLATSVPSSLVALVCCVTTETAKARCIAMNYRGN